MPHGGKRQGAGRPKTIKGDGEHVVVTVRLSKSLYKKLLSLKDEDDTIGKTVRDCIRYCSDNMSPIYGRT